MALTSQAKQEIQDELITDPEGLGYTGANRFTDHAILVEQRSFGPKQYTQREIAPTEVAWILIKRGAWRGVVEAAEGSLQNHGAFKLVEASKLPGITVGWSVAETIVTGLISDGVLATADGLALQNALRTEKFYTRAEEIGYPNISIDDVQAAINYEVTVG